MLWNFIHLFLLKKTCLLFLRSYGQAGLGVWPAVLRLWEAGDGHLGVGGDVCLHPACSLLHPGVLGVSVPQIVLQVGAVSRHGPCSVCSADLRARALPHPRGHALPAATGLTLHCDLGAGEFLFKETLTYLLAELHRLLQTYAHWKIIQRGDLCVNNWGRAKGIWWFSKSQKSSELKKKYF